MKYSYILAVAYSIFWEFPNFTCDNGAEINFVDVCDGEPNCSDGSDETECDNDAILFYYTYVRGIPALYGDCALYDDPKEYSSARNFDYYGCANEHYYGFKKLNVTGIYLNENKEFSVTVHDDKVPGRYHIFWEKEVPPLTNIRVSSNGPRLDIAYGSHAFADSDEDFVEEVTRDGSNRNMLSIGENIRNLVVDSVTTHVYYTSNSKIKVCDKNFIICVALSSKFISDPILLAISSKCRLLFWIEKVATHQFYLYKYSIEKSLTITPALSQGLKAPTWLTVDPVQERVYWMDYSDNGEDVIPSIYSMTFDGTNLELIPGTLKSLSSFAVFDNTLYWSDNSARIIWKCSAGDCNQPIPFKKVDLSALLVDYKHGYQSQIGSLIIDHRSSSSNKIQNACTNSSCSHLCLLDSETLFNCYCEGSEKPLPTTTMSNGYCEGITLIATYQNHLYIVGLFSNSELAPIITEKTIKNISSISTVTYNSIKGSVILTEMEQQKIYRWIPRTGDLTLLSDDGPGSIKSIEFDNYSNNLYWIDPAYLGVKVMNLDTLSKTVILEGNPTYHPIEFTLAAAKGFMFVQFLKNNSSIVLERISMDGRRTKPPIHADKEIEDMGSLHLHYMRDAETLYLLDRQRNKIRCLLNEKSGFQDLTYSGSVGEIEGITSLSNSIVWWEDDLMIRRGKVGTPQTLLITTPKISLGLKEYGNGVLRLAPIVKSVVQPRSAKCLRNNGGCEELCLVTEKNPKFTCACTGSKILVNGSFCRHKASEVVTVSTTSQNSENVTTERHVEQASPTTENVAQKIGTKTELTPVKSNENYRPNSEINTRKNDSSVCVKSCPICQTSICPPSGGQLSSTNHIFHSIFIALLATMLGFTLSCLFQNKNVTEDRNVQFHQASGILELSRMQAESTMTLCSKIDESVNNLQRT